MTSTNAEEDKTLQNNVCVKIQHVKTGKYLSVKKKSFFVAAANKSGSKTSPTSGSGVIGDQEHDKNGGDDGNIGFGNQLYQPIEDLEITQAYRNVVELK